MDDAAEFLLAKFGTTSPYWRLSLDSDALSLSSDQVTTAMAVALTVEQAADIRAMTGVTSHRTLQISLQGYATRLHIVGRKINMMTWAGTAAGYNDTPSVARDLEDGLSFAERVVSEVNSLVVIIDSEGKLKRFNRLCEEITGLKESDLLGKDALEMFMMPEDLAAIRGNIRGFFQSMESFETERPIRTKNGVRHILWRNKLVDSGSGEKERFLVCSGTDVTEEKAAKQKLIQLANNDTLTGLPNRYAIQQVIEAALAQGDEFALMFIDLDNFKKVNDYYGHLVGDDLIREASQAIRACLRGEDVLSRFGGDEFLVLVGEGGARSAEEISKRIQELVKKPFHCRHDAIYSSCSIGIALYPEHGATQEDLVRNADIAMYAAKEAGRNTDRFFSPEMNLKVSEFVWLDTNLRRALEEQQFELYYQPKRCMKTGAVDSVEALIRWHSPQRGTIAPDNFIPYAEESGLIVPMGKWVMEAAARQASAWKTQGVDLRIAVNVSARQLRHPSIVEDFAAALDAAHQPVSLLDLEITESCVIEDEAVVVDLLDKFRRTGAMIHLDDFGTGYSSLSQLSRLPLAAFKLDRSFIQSIHADTRAQRLLRSMAAVARQLQMKVVAEGVETKEQARFLKEIGIDYGQGYLYAKPMPADQMAAWWLAQRPLRVVK
ncbi:MAG: cyclic di-GMP phosphodiesterase [Burkholderiaceae bacterium]